MKPLDPRLLRYARSARAYLAVTVALGVAQAALIVAMATLLAYGITAVFLDGASLADLGPTLIALIAVVAGRGLIAWAQEAAAVRSAAGVKSELRGRLLAHLTALGPFAGAPDTGAAVTLTVRGLDALDSYFARYLPQLVLAALVPFVVLARIFPADLVATLTIALTLPLIPVFMALVGLKTEADNRRQFRLLARLSHHFLDVIAGLPTLKLFGRAASTAASIRRISDEQRRVTMRTLRIAFLSSLVLELLATLSVALVAVGIGLRLVGGELDLRTALLVLILAPEAYLPLRQVGAHYHASAEGLAAAGEAFAVLESPLPASGSVPAPLLPRTAASPPLSPPVGAPSPSPTSSSSPAGGISASPAGTIVFDDVSVPFRSSSLNLTAEISPGETVALTGPSGCGKSTALNLLLGFTRPASGRITASGADLSTLDLSAWRAQIAWVPQRPHLFAGTIHDNIALGTRASAAAVAAAAASAGAASFIEALPDGYATRLGDNGTGLSAGQRQRIALARAFLRDAPLVLLDEPTANLDRATAAEVMAAIRRLAEGRTVLIAAHRPELIALADRVLTVGGR